MFRYRISNFTLHRNISSKIELLVSINPKLMSNLKPHNFNSGLNVIRNRNYEIGTDELAKDIFPIAVNEILLNSHKNSTNNSNKTKARNSLNKLQSQHVWPSTNYILTRSNSLHKTSTLLSSKNSYVKESCIKPFGVRHFSSEVTQYGQVQLTGFWKDMSESAPVEFVQDSLISFQSFTHLPWWATIVLTTLIVRSTMTLPLSLYQHYILAKVQNLQVDMNEIVKTLKVEANFAVSRHNWSEEYTRKVFDLTLKKKWTELIQKENCHPAKGLIVLWTQIPLWITISTALRNLCYMLPPGHTNAEEIYLELTTGGFGWVVNLIDVDHYWILPVSIGVFNLVNVEIMTLMKTKQDTKLQKYLLNFFRFISIAMVPIATYVPSCICIYWASSSAFGVLQNLLLLSPKVRRLGGVPLTSTEVANPYRELIRKFRAKKYFNFSRKGTSSE